MKGVGSEVARGAAWMVALRLLQRSLGIVSTAILARLLVPDDFGVIAMALSIVALVELIGVLGFDLALIRTVGAGRPHFDTAWTLGLLFKAMAAASIALGAPLVSDFYSDGRLTSVLYVYAAVVLLGGVENVGIVAFRRDLEFDREFRFQLAKKFIAVCVTAVLAFLFKSYWALAFGALFSSLTGVVLSYVMHAYRPRLCLTEWRSMLGFSSWVLFNNLCLYVRDRGPDFVIGRMLGAQSLGTFRVASEVASLPTTELYAPMMRVVFPGFARIKDDSARLKRAYLYAQASVATVTLPAGLAVVLLAEPIVLLLLGGAWTSAIPLIRLLGLYGMTKILHGNRHSLFMAMGRPHWIGLMVLFELVVVYPLMIYWLNEGHGVEMVAWAKLVSTIVVLPFGMTLVSKVLMMGRFEMVGAFWRPFLATAAMAGTVVGLQTFDAPTAGILSLLRNLVLPAFGGLLIYVILLLALWIAVGRPDGLERRVLEAVPTAKLLPVRLRAALLGARGGRIS